MPEGVTHELEQIRAYLSLLAAEDYSEVDPKHLLGLVEQYAIRPQPSGWGFSAVGTCLSNKEVCSNGW